KHVLDACRPACRRPLTQSYRAGYAIHAYVMLEYRLNVQLTALSKSTNLLKILNAVAMRTKGDESNKQLIWLFGCFIGNLHLSSHVQEESVTSRLELLYLLLLRYVHCLDKHSSIV